MTFHIEHKLFGITFNYQDLPPESVVKGIGWFAFDWEGYVVLKMPTEIVVVDKDTLVYKRFPTQAQKEEFPYLKEEHTTEVMPNEKITQRVRFVPGYRRVVSWEK